MSRRNILSMVILFGMLISQTVPRAMAAGCDSAQFISDLTIPDGSPVAPGAAFTKTWRLQNNGTCTWNTSYSMVWAGGDAMGSTNAARLPVSVSPGQMVDISVSLAAPVTPGHYKSLWKLSNPSGGQFGIGAAGNDPFWADINVVDNSAVVFDFVANAPYAQWRSGAGVLPYPGTSGDSRGYSFQVNNPHLEDDSFASEPGLLTVPQNKYNGYIQATYPEFQVQPGDKLQTLVNCEFGATSCYVTFRIDYIQPNGVQKTFWSWKEAYDKRFYRANLDLSSLAGQRVRFVFMLLSSGLAGGDRAVWGSPRIVRMGTTQPPAPPATLTALPPLTPTATPITPPPPTTGPAGCDRATFVTDVTVQDGTVFAPGAAFTKTWRLKNSGSCIWTTAYKLVYYSGEQMSSPTTVNLPWGAVHDQTVDISVNMVAPSSTGAYRGFWILANASGKFFGIGANASDPVWVDINVAGDSPTDTTSYDFLANACSAQWKSGAGALPCPGTNGDSRGFVLAMNPAKLEDGSANTPGLLTFPQNRYNGYIQGSYPTFTVQPGDHFKSTVGCEYGSANCYVNFRLDYMAANGFIGTFWQWHEASDGKTFAADVDLTPLAGRSVRFILTLLATGNAATDRAVWAEPRIVRADSVPVTFTPTSTSIPAQWLTYTNQQYGFQFMYPPQSQILSQTPTYLKMNLPFTPGTNLVEKYLETVVVENANPCQSPLSSTSPPGSPTETVVINGIPFFKQVGGDAAAGNHYEWVAYSTLQGNACISMDFVLHSLGAIDPTPPNYDKAAESAVFTQIMSTFNMTAPPITPSFTPTPTAPTTPVPGSGTVVPSPQIQKLFMQDSTVGWAIGNPYVLWTMDGGGTWYNVTATGVSNIQNAYFQNSSKGWVLATASDSGLPVLLRTINGGATWTSYGNLPFNGGYIQFLDDLNGYVLSGESSGMNKQAVKLYKTIDGGATWTLKYANDPSQPNNTLPFGGHKNGMTFRDNITGWVGGDIPTPGFAYFYRTDDGGTTWVQQPLPIPAGYESAGVFITAPTFFSYNDGVLPVWMSTNAGRDLFLYVTHDSGLSWNPSGSFAHQSFNTDVVSTQDAFTWDTAGYFHATNDAGSNWRQVNPNINFGDSVRDMDFVSPFHGWVLDVDGSGNLALYRTSDGGLTWNALFGNTAPPSLPDLTISAMRIELQNPSCFNPGDTMGVRLSVTNSGQGTTGAFTVRVNDADQTVNSLGAGETATLFFPGYTNPVTATVDVTNLVAESNENNNSVTQMVPIPTPPLPCITTTPSPTPIPVITPTIIPTQGATLMGPYAVVNVPPNDVLNIRSSAGSSQPVVGSIPYNAVSIMRTGPTATAEGATWVEVQNPSGGLGWVNSFYLTEYVLHSDFCADPRVTALIDQLKGSVNQSNGDMLANIVSPVHGVNVNLWAYASPTNFNTTTAHNIFTSADSHNWGGGPSGTPDVGTFSQVIQPKLQEVFNAPNMSTYCDDLTNVFPLANPWPYTNIRYYNLYKPATAQQFDFRTWLIGIEYVNGQPYLHSMVSIVWEP